MVGNMKTSTKVVAGFGVLLTILAGLALVSYSMFGSVAANVTGLTDHSLSAVRAVTKVQLTASDTLAAQKNYMLYKTIESHEQVERKLAELSGTLDQVDQVARQFKDTELADKAREMRGLASRFGRLYDEAATALKSNETASNRGAGQGQAMQAETDAFCAAKKREYWEAIGALAAVNEVASLTWQARYDRRNWSTKRTPRWSTPSPGIAGISADASINWRRCIPTPTSNG